jgi:hypothetical protein
MKEFYLLVCGGRPFGFVEATRGEHEHISEWWRSVNPLVSVVVINDQATRDRAAGYLRQATHLIGGDDEMVLIDDEVLDRLATARGGYDRETLASLGVQWPPGHGWKRDLRGTKVPKSTIDRLIAGRMASKAAWERRRRSLT